MSSDLSPSGFVERMRALLPATGPDGAAAVYPLHEPSLLGREKELLADCIDSTFVSSVGAYVDRMEADLARITGATRAVVVSNGTAALQVALLLAGVEPDDLVICPALTFVATANAISHCGASPLFLDVEEETLGLDPAALRSFLRAETRHDGERLVHRASGRRIAALLPVHIFGNPARIEALVALADAHNLPVVEDAAESLASYAGATHTGLFGVAGALSFNGNKLVTTGGGGAVLTMNEELGARAKHLTTTAKTPHRWAYEHTEVAFNYRMPNLNAALGVAQLEQLSSLLDRKARLYGRWREVFSGSAYEVLAPREGTRANHWLNAVVLPPSAGIDDRDALLDAACDAGIFCRPIWAPMHQLPMYASCLRGPLPVTEDLHARVINLPSTAHLVPA